MSKLKLELKHIAPYLPYGLRFIDHIYKYELLGIKKETKKTSIKVCLRCSNKEIYSYYIDENFDLKPILRPLTEIKDIEEIMDEFSEFSWEGFQNHFFDNILGRSLNCFDNVNYTIVELCFKHHLDIFGLIEKDLAIDINTLNKYKNEQL